MNAEARARPTLTSGRATPITGTSKKPGATSASSTSRTCRAAWSTIRIAAWAASSTPQPPPVISPSGPISGIGRQAPLRGVRRLRPGLRQAQGIGRLLQPALWPEDGAQDRRTADFRTGRRHVREGRAAPAGDVHVLRSRRAVVPKPTSRRASGSWSRGRPCRRAISSSLASTRRAARRISRGTYGRPKTSCSGRPGVPVAAARRLQQPAVLEPGRAIKPHVQPEWVTSTDWRGVLHLPRVCARHRLLLGRLRK